MSAGGIWVRFQRPTGQDEQQVWLSIGRAWFLDLRGELAGAWREQFGAKVPNGSNPKGWVSEELRKRGVKLSGREVVFLPHALHARIRIADGGDSSGPAGEWVSYDTILPIRKTGPMGGIRKSFQEE